MKKILFLILFISFNFVIFAQNKKGILFQFKHNKGDSVSHISTVEEEAYLNGRLNNHTQFINRTSTTVTDLDENGNEYLHTQYMTTQNSLINRSGNYLSWGEEDSVNICRTPEGFLFNSDNEFLPTVRNVPAFPDYPVKPGDTWNADGFEVHDCRELFNMDEPIVIPFTANYEYVRDENVNGTILQLIEVNYEFYQENPRNNILKGSSYAGSIGFARQMIYWDCEKNDLDHYTENFQIKMVDIYGMTYLYKGVSHGEVTEYNSVNNDATVKKLQKKIDKYKLNDISVTKGEKGLTISLENIQFEPDSNLLLPSEKIKLDKIGILLKEFSNDLLITGHCAERGTVNARQKLSEERADAVAKYLVSNGIRDEYHIFTQGKGSTQPVASNDTEEGRKRNRRVEITIMD